MCTYVHTYVKQMGIHLLCFFVCCFVHSNNVFGIHFYIKTASKLVALSSSHFGFSHDSTG
jgi:hypothetical protein